MINKKYIKLKEENPNNYYLFKIGMFYVFFEEDAKNISKITTLKITNHSNNMVKCGFPENSLTKYLEIFKNLGINVVIINDLEKKQTNEEKIKKYLKKIKSLDINNKVTPMQGLMLLSELKEILDNE